MHAGWLRQAHGGNHLLGASGAAAVSPQAHGHDGRAVLRLQPHLLHQRPDVVAPHLVVAQMFPLYAFRRQEAVNGRTRLLCGHRLRQRRLVLRRPQLRLQRRSSQADLLHVEERDSERKLAAYFPHELERRQAACQKDVEKLAAARYADGQRRRQRELRVRREAFRVGHVHVGAAEGTLPDAHQVEMGDELHLVAAGEADAQTLDLHGYFFVTSRRSILRPRTSATTIRKPSSSTCSPSSGMWPRRSRTKPATVS